MSQKTVTLADMLDTFTAYPKATPHAMLRSGLWTFGFASLVAYFTFRSYPNPGFEQHWVLALTVGACYWLVGVGLTRLPDRFKPTLNTAWYASTAGRRWFVLFIVAKLAATVAGTWLGSKLSGIDLWSGSHEARMGLVLALATGIVGSQVMSARSRAHALRLQLAEVERDAAQARLRLLQAQLEPHMLFNTLANLRALVRIDAGRAEHMIDQLNRFLRTSLSASQGLVHPLRDELARLQDYLGLMQVRMGDRLAVQVDVPEDLLALPVPALLLQPLVENAIRHGLEPCVQGGTIHLSARVTHSGPDAMLTLTVCDDGLGLPDETAPAAPPATPHATHQGGLGLSHVRERLAQLHGQRASLHLSAQAPRGTCASVSLPLHPTPPQKPCQAP